MNSVVDRVPTQVLSNGAIRWEQFDENGDSLGYVYLKRADEPTVEGTAINKVLFDSIKTDLTNLFNNKQDNSATGSFTWNANDNTNVNVGFKPKLVIAISDTIHVSASNKRNRTVILLDGYGIMIEGGTSGATIQFFDNLFSSTGFTVKPLNTINDTYIFQSATSKYIAFK